MRLALIAFLLIVTGWFIGTAQADPLTVGQLAARCGKLDLSEANQIKLRSASIGDALDGGKCWGHLEAYTDVASLALPNSPHPPGSARPIKTTLLSPKWRRCFFCTPNRTLMRYGNPLLWQSRRFSLKNSPAPSKVLRVSSGWLTAVQEWEWTA